MINFEIEGRIEVKRGRVERENMILPDNKIQFDYELTKEDYKALCNFSMFFRKRSTIFLFSFVMIVCSIILLGKILGLMEMPNWYFNSYLALMVLFLIIILAQKIGVAKVLKTDKVNFHSTRQYTVDHDHFSVNGGKEKGSSEFEWNLFYQSYETKKYFFLYISNQQAFSLSKKIMTKEESILLRKILEEKMGKNFHKRCR